MLPRSGIPPDAACRTKGLAHRLEGVQRRSARWVFNDYRRGPNGASPTAMMAQLNWPLLSTRRTVARLCMMYKMHNGMVKMAYSSLLVLHPYQLHLNHPFTFLTLDRTPLKHYFSNSFFPRTVCDWNSLSAGVFPPVPPPDSTIDPQARLAAFKTAVWAELTK